MPVDSTILISLSLSLQDGRNALHIAIVYSCAHLVEFLLQQGANIEARTNAGNTPFLLACHFPSVEVIDALVYRGACLDVVNGVSLSLSFTFLCCYS